MRDVSGCDGSVIALPFPRGHGCSPPKYSSGVRRLLAALVVAVASVSGIAIALAPRGDGAATAVPTYHRDVAPILNGKCATCHRTGGIAPFSLTSVADAKAHAAGIAAMTKAGLMPPWMPGPDSAPLVGRSLRRLTDAELDTLARWAAAGAPAGSPATARSKAPTGTGLTGPGRTVTLQPPKAYVPSAPGGALDDYHCFLLDPKLAADAFVTGALIQPQRSGIVHHVILYEAVGQQVAAAERLNRASGGKGWTCFGGPNLPLDLSGADAVLRLGSPQWVAAWVPGHVTNSVPAGVGVRLRTGSRIVMQVHYNLIRAARADRSKVVLKLRPATARLKPLETMLVAAPIELPCPAGASGALCSRDAVLRDLAAKYGPGAGTLPNGLLALCGKTLADYPQDVGAGTSIGTSCDRAIDRRMTIRGVAGHMHLRGRDVSLVLDPGTAGERTLLHIPHWDFHWQDAYYLQKPVTVGPGHTVRLTCRFDNSAVPARYVVWGEGTTDEMCLGVLAVTLG